MNFKGRHSVVQLTGGGYNWWVMSMDQKHPPFHPRKAVCIPCHSQKDCILRNHPIAVLI